MSPHVSVIVPIFNSAKTIKRALDSVVAQSYSNLEVIVVDDGSSDQSANLVEQIGIKDVKVIKHSQNRGAAAARNSGIKVARGNWIAFLDSDDTWKPEKLRRQIETLEASGASRRLACATGYVLHRKNQVLTVRLDLSPEKFRHDILFGCTISPGTTLLVDRRTFDEIGFFDENLRRLEDWDWLLRFSLRQDCDMLILPQQLADIYVTYDKFQFSFDSDPVMRSIARIGTRQLPAFSGAARKQLRSSLLVEKAARYHRAVNRFWRSSMC